MILEYSETECKSLDPQVGSLEADGEVRCQSLRIN